MKSSAGKIQVSRFSHLFGAGDMEPGVERVQDILLSELHPFKGHPVHVRDDDAMRKTVESIAEYGVLSPGIARPRSEGAVGPPAQARERACG